MTNLVMKSSHYAGDKVYIDTIKLFNDGNKVQVLINNGRHANGKPRGGRINLTKEQAEALQSWLANIIQK